MQNILFIDGRNFISKASYVLNPSHKKDINIDFSAYNFSGLFDKVLAGIKLDKKIFYLGKLEKHSDTKDKSDELIYKQRLLKLNLEKYGFEVVLTGRVRGHIERCPKGHEVLTFKEKGVDVKMAVDMMTLACNNKLKIAVIGSSDSDLQPAVLELKNYKVQSIYLGFESQPNKGLTYTTDRTILIRNSELGEFISGLRL